MIRPQAVVTGGVGDIGRAAVAALSAHGFDVLALDLLPFDEGERIVADLAVPGGGALAYARCNCRDETNVLEVFSKLDRVDFVLLNAAVVEARPFLSIDVDGWRRQIDVNLTAAFIVARVAANTMVAKETPGQLLFMSSWVAERPWPDLAAYTESKTAVNQLSRQIAKELAEVGIRSNCLAPGIVRAGLTKGLLETDPIYAARVEASIPLGELQTAEEVAQMVAVLAGGSANSMTGSVITMDGGCSLGAP